MPKRSAVTSEFVVPSDLGPGAARELHVKMLTWLTEKSEAGTVEVSPGSEEISISAVQLVVSATRSRADQPPALGPLAKEAISALSKPRVLEPAAR